MKKYTLKKQILFISSILVISTILLYSGFIILVSSFLQRDMLLHRESMAQIIVDQINESINLPLELTKNVEMLLENYPIEGREITNYLEALQDAYPYFSEIHLISHEGIIINTTPYEPALVGNDVKFEPYYIELSDNIVDYQWSEIYASSNTGKPTITVTVPRNGYQIAIDLDLERLPISLSSEKYFEEVYSIFILDEWGSYIIADEPKKVLERHRYEHFDKLLVSEKENSWFYDDELQVGVHTMNSPKWYILIDYDIGSLGRGINALSFWSLLFWVLVVTGITLSLRRYFKKIYHDITSLKNKTQSIIEGRPLVDSEVSLKYEEFEGFNQDFNQMVGVIKSREKELDNMNVHLDALVKERTLALQEANRKLEKEIVEKEEAKERIRRLNESLDRKVKERTKQLEELNQALTISVEKAEEANAAKSRFLSIMSHEMRTPLNGIKGFMQMLKKTPLSDEQQDFITTVVNSSDILLSLIDDLLDVEKYASGKMTFANELVKLEEAIRSIAQPFTKIAEEKGLFFKLNMEGLEESLVRIDYFKLKQLLNNLLSNAIKFTPDGGVTVSISSLKKNQHYCIDFSIADTGIGIPDGAHEYLFEPFSQVDGDTANEYGGTGLGLSICKEIVNYYQGSISFESEIGKGTTFFGQLMVADGLESEAEVDHSSLRSSQEMKINARKIMVAEDNLVNQKLMKKFFEKHHMDIIIANNGQEAIDICKHEAIDLILMDCQMPVMDGFEASRVIKSLRGEEVEIVAMTAFASQDDRQKCFDAGMDYFLSKPVDLDYLEELLGLGKEKELEEVEKSQIIEKEIQLLMKRIDFDYETSSDLINTFIDQMKVGIKELEGLLINKQFDEAEKKVHQLKGAAGAVRIDRLLRLIIDLETALKNANENASRLLLKMIREDSLLS